MKESNLEKIVSLCKRRGFVFPGSELYGGLAGTWDYGPMGVALKNNIREAWWRRFVLNREDMYGMDAAILMNQKVWQATGHTSGFSDPIIECLSCKSPFREDSMFAGYASAYYVRRTVEENGKVIYDYSQAPCPVCGKIGNFSKTRQFNMMFQTIVGAADGATAVSYLRPETAQGMFVNFKNIIDSYHPKLPFGMCQIGKAFRNEIAPRDFTFRAREFEQMEIEYFVKQEEWEKHFEHFREQIVAFFESIGIQKNHVHELEVPDEDRAFYSKRTIDFEFDFPFGKNELCGLAYRTDYDLGKHSDASGTALHYLDEESRSTFIPHCIEPSFGLDRTMLAVLADAYMEDEMGEEVRIYLKLNSNIAPIKVAVFPLVKNKPQLIEKGREVFGILKKQFGAVMWDDNGNIGKRYRRQDEIGTPWCVTVDYQTLEDNTVTVRDRDTGEQIRKPIAELAEYFANMLK